MSVNKAILIGNVGQEPVINNFENGKVANFTLATTKKGFKMQNGTEVPDKTFWHNIKVNNAGLVNVVGQYVHKGDKLYIEGEIQNRQYEKNGMKLTYTEIVVNTMEMLGSKQGATQQQPQHTQSVPYAEQIPETDDLPF